MWSRKAAVKSALHHKEPVHLYCHVFCGSLVTFLRRYFTKSTLIAYKIQMSFKVSLGKDGHKQMCLLVPCETGPEAPRRGLSLSFGPSQHAFKIGKPRISSLHITSLTFSSKMYFIRSKVYIMAVYNAPLQICQEICEMELPQHRCSKD